MRVLHPHKQGIPILGTIAASGFIEPFTDSIDYLDFSHMALPPDTYGLRVAGDSMIDDLIADGDLVFLHPVLQPDQLKNGTIVAARVDGYGTTLKRFYRLDDMVTLKPANPNYQPIEILATQVEVQGSLVAVWRVY